MNSQSIGLRVASVIFAIFAIFHAVRLFKHVEVSVATHVIPMGVSWVGVVVGALLCIWLRRLSAAR